MANTQTPKLRSACDACHEAKVRCSGGTPCMHCKNHHHSCHYSFAARIGKPKGSRNRKTLARLREAALNAAVATSQQPFASSLNYPAPSSFSTMPASTVADWSAVEYPMTSSYQNAHSTSYAWVAPQPIPTPPESVDLGCKTLPLHNDPLLSQTSHAEITSSPPQTHAGDLYSTSSGSPSYHAPFQSTPCDCFHWQTSSVSSLQALKSPSRVGQHDTFDESLQCIAATLTACQRTAGCLSCEKDSSLILILIASLQMAVSQLEAQLFGQWKGPASHSFPSPASTMLGVSQFTPGGQSTVRFMQLRHMLARANNTLRDLREAIEVAKIRSPGRKASDTALLGSDQNDPEYLWHVLDRLQAGIDTLDSTLNGYSN
ncbi:hypothetical protein BGW36DRAFT_361032 [Talaromyces proteolyticus]|uniref:Zn(2)-C6 fungal-type domain-containing protein n=1 Tax=Talaromyces proteolyticus TaxID=1131652 RepID=A0AAD4KRD5_9EURO|nr:uncharacterized protein BGW36DRAFT_361032 [Talaromyces proteolyticus]KAH8695331.1 hypothetical protein BGW36DRAFT_361032 [Talaromyces proteolyticus]